MTLALGDLFPSNLDVVSCRNHGNGPLRPCLDNSRFFVKRSWLQRRPQSPVHYFITSVEILESMRACLCRSEDIAEVLTRLLALRDTVAGSKDRRVSLLRSIRAVSGQCQQPLRTRRSRGHLVNTSTSMSELRWEDLNCFLLAPQASCDSNASRYRLVPAVTNHIRRK